MRKKAFVLVNEIGLVSHTDTQEQFLGYEFKDPARLSGLSSVDLEHFEILKRDYEIASQYLLVAEGTGSWKIYLDKQPKEAKKKSECRQQELELT